MAVSNYKSSKLAAAKEKAPEREELPGGETREKRDAIKRQKKVIDPFFSFVSFQFEKIVDTPTLGASPPT